MILTPPRRSSSIVTMSIFLICLIALNTRLAAAASESVIAFVRAIGVICQDTPFVFAAAALTLLAAVVDDGVPVTISFRLVNGCDLKREGFVVLELGAAVERSVPS